MSSMLSYSPSEGELTVQIAERTFQAGAGRFVLSPGGTVHTSLAVVTQDATSHHHPVHLVGPIVDPRGARRAIEHLERRLPRHAHGAVRLDGAVDHVVEHLRAEELDERH